MTEKGEKERKRKGGNERKDEGGREQEGNKGGIGRSRKSKKGTVK